MKNQPLASQPRLFPTAPVIQCGPTRFDTFDDAKAAGVAMQQATLLFSFVDQEYPFKYSPKFCQNCNGWHVLVAL